MRLFIAHRIDEHTCKPLAMVTAALRHELPRASWTGADGYHLTFAFLGEQSEEVIERIAAELRPRIAEIVPFDAVLNGAGFFPNDRRPRVGWIGAEPKEPLMAVAARVRDALLACGVSFDEKPFHPHLTLARIKDPWRSRDVAEFRSAVEATRSVSFQVGRVALFESRLLPTGAVHTEAAAFTLG